MLEIKNLSYRVQGEDGPIDILKNVSLNIEEKKFVVITGPNGGGKTSLARAIMGIYQPTGGQILWNGTDITELSVTDRARMGISYGFQQPPRFKGMKVRDLLTMCLGQGKEFMMGEDRPYHADRDWVKLSLRQPFVHDLLMLAGIEDGD